MCVVSTVLSLGSSGWSLVHAHLYVIIVRIGAMDAFRVSLVHRLAFLFCFQYIKNMPELPIGKKRNGGSRETMELAFRGVILF